MFMGHLIKSNHRAQRKNKVDTYGAAVLHLTIVPLLLAAKMCTNTHEYSIYIRILWSKPRIFFSHSHARAQGFRIQTH
jgi:hypothetical protein